MPADTEGVDFDDAALDELQRLTDGYPYFVQAYGKATWDVATGSPITRDDVLAAAPDAEAELAVGFFGVQVRAGHPGRARLHDGDGRPRRSTPEDGPVSTADLARHLGRKPQSLSPARDGLIKKGLVYSGERGRVAFTVPHFGQFLRGR